MYLQQATERYVCTYVTYAQVPTAEQWRACEYCIALTIIVCTYRTQKIERRKKIACTIVRQNIKSERG